MRQPFWLQIRGVSFSWDLMKIFRVTEVFGRYLPATIPERRLNYAADRGTRAHEHCFRKARRAYIPRKTMDGDVYLFFRSFEQWFDTYVVKVLFIEPELADPVLGFKGHPDLGLVIKPNEQIIIDLKTPIQHKAIWAGQCAAYLHLARFKYPAMTKSGTMQLDPLGGMPKVTWYDFHIYDFAAFTNLLHGVRYFSD